MIERYALAYSRLMHELTTVLGSLYHRRFLNGLEKKGDVFPSNEYPANQVLEALEKAKEHCQMLPLGNLIPDIDRLIEQSTPAAMGDRLQIGTKRIIDRIHDELAAHKLFHVAPSDVELYESTAPFGEAVAKKFSLLSTDISEASKCLALSRYTACVFHLMRVMEVAVQRLAKKLKIAVPTGKAIADMEWGSLIIEVNRKVAGMAPGKRRETYAGVAAHLGTVGLGWRNPTMHPKATYTLEEARAIWNSVDSFMRALDKVV